MTTFPSADSSLLPESDRIVDLAKKFVVIMKDGKSYKNTVK